ncbi:hypothetical protein JCM11491_004886 [Sporobolomyces phaffii]
MSKGDDDPTMRRVSLVSRHLSSSTPTPTPRARAPPRASEYRYFVPFQSTWRDNDMYGHFNNVTYSQYFDSITNEYLLNECRMNATTDPIGLIVHSETSFASQLAYPEPVVAAVSIATLSRRKIVWNVALFKARYTTTTTTPEGDGGRGEFGRKVGLVEPPEGKGEGEATAAAWGTMTHVFVERGGERTKVVDALPAKWTEKLERLVVGETHS